MIHQKCVWICKGMRRKNRHEKIQPLWQQHLAFCSSPYWDFNPHGFCRVGTPETNWNSTSFEWIDDARLYLACQGNFGYDFACHTDAAELAPSNLFSFIAKNSQSLHRACDSHCHHSIHICQIQSYLSNPPIVHSSLPGLQRVTHAVRHVVASVSGPTLFLL